MDKPGHNQLMPVRTSLIDKLTPEQIQLRLTEGPYVQSQDHSWSIERRTLNDYDLFLCTGGVARFQMNSTDYLLHTGEALLVPPHTEFSASLAGGTNFEAIAQHFTLKVLARHDLFEMIRYQPHVTFGDRWPTVRSYMHRYVEFQQQNTRPMAQHSLFLLVIGEFLDVSYVEDADSYDGPDIFIVEMVHTLHRNLSDEAVLDSAFALSPYTKDYTTRVFKKHMGATPKQFLISHRLRIAREVLQQGYRIKEVSQAVGYHDELYFSRLFRRKIGTSPGEYRRRV
jgi:AraC-like DNA-binding protein